MSDPRRNTVFISYPTEDYAIAAAINQAIKNLEENKLDVFFDQERLSSGQRIPNTIQDALKKTIYFVAVATDVSRRNFDWCGRELGFYQGAYGTEGRRETCLYHLTFPGLFAESRNFKVQSLQREHTDHFLDHVVLASRAQFYEFLRGIAELNEQLHPPGDKSGYWSKVPSWAEKHAGLITGAFFEALQSRVENTWYPQGRVQLSIQNGDFYKQVLPSIPGDTEVVLSGAFFNTFGANQPEPIRPITWEKFIEFLMEYSGNDILASMITDIAISALPSRADAKADYIYQAPNQSFYRILLVKHSIRGNRQRELIFNLVRTREKVKGGDQTTTMLVAGILLGSKYRSIFVEEGSKYELAQFNEQKLEEGVARVDQMLQDLNQINADAAADGLADHTSLQGLLGNSYDTEKLYRDWYAVFPPMLDAARELVNRPTNEGFERFRQTYRTFVGVSRNNNTKFLVLCLDAYRRRLQPDASNKTLEEYQTRAAG